jgi:serine/threonine protein kinase/WD40 repeat protein
MTHSHGQQRIPSAPPVAVDAICDAFEAAWFAGQEPRIEDFLSRIDSVPQDELLRELLLAEWDLRRRHAQHVELPTYLERFAQNSQFVAKLWHEWQAQQAECSLNGEARGFATALHAAPLEELGTVIDRYKLLEKLGEGGFGSVWAAEQREPVKRRVALKVIKLGMDTRQVIARFEAERQALALMDHPNIAKVLDAGATETGRPYFVMELVRGTPITTYCDQERLATPPRLDLFMKVCNAIQHAHQKGVIHRDIKPSNILVTLHDGVPVPKVIDFGIAKATQQELTEKTIYTQMQQFIGTPAYMSPEQAEMSGLDIDTRSDIYSLGVLLYELLTGTTPFDAKELMRSGPDEMRKIIREREPLTPSSRLMKDLETAKSSDSDRHSTSARHAAAGSRKRTIDPDLDWIVMKCLEKDRTRRYETASGLAADIQRHLAHEQVVARPPSAVYKLQKAWQRNKLVFTTGAIVASALVAGIGVSTWQAIRATRATKGEFEQRIAAQTAKTKAETEQQRANAQAQKASESERNSRRFLYASDMNLAQEALKLNNLGKARRLLDRHRPSQAGEEDLRGWEWRYLWQLTRGNAPFTLTNRPTPGFSVGFSLDGKSLAVGWWDGRVDLWDVPARRWVRALTDGERPHPGRVAFSPVRNLLAATSEPNTVTLYDLDSGRESILWRMTDQGGWDVRDLAFSQDGSKVVIYSGSNPEADDAVWVVDVAPTRIESRHPAGRSLKEWAHTGAARLSPDNRRLYLVRSDDWNGCIQCIDLGTSQEVWQTKRQGEPLIALDISPDGRVLASASGWTDTRIHLWDTATGEPLTLKPLEGHTAFVLDLTFTRDGLISAGGDQTIRFWDTNTWTESREPLRGHAGEVWAIAISELAQLIASVSKDGDFKLWTTDGKRAADGCRRLSESLGVDDVQPLDHSRVLLLPQGQPPELVDLKRDSHPVPLPQIGSSTNVLGCFGTNDLCVWNGTNQILVGELRGTEFVERGAMTLDSGLRPTGFAYNSARRLLAWTEGSSPTSLYLASLATPGRRIELRSDIPGLVPFRFSEDGNYLAAARERETLRTWNVESGQIVARIDQNFNDACFAAKGSVLVVAFDNRIRDEIGFYDLARPDRGPQRVRGGFVDTTLTVSPDGGLVSATSNDSQILLFNAAKGELIDSLRGHLIIACSTAFSPDGRRLCSTDRRQEAVKLWDVGTHQELLTLGGTDPALLAARWSADGDVILAGPPWQAWSAPSWEEIAAAEAKEKTESTQP